MPPLRRRHRCCLPWCVRVWLQTRPLVSWKAARLDSFVQQSKILSVVKYGELQVILMLSNVFGQKQFINQLSSLAWRNTRDG